jgi:serine/threonine-protein kinase
MEQIPAEPSDQTRLSDDPPQLEMTTVKSARAPDGPENVEEIDPVGLHGPPQVGKVFFGRYLVERPIGEGGMGTVWLVRHVELKAQRALKLIVSDKAFEPQMRARFRREAEAMARLSHPSAVVVHDARIGRESAFIEMEYIRGTSLNNLLAPGVPMPLDWVTRIAEQLCDVLQEAHQEKIVHRDLKPSNLMLVENRPPGKELLKVLDFGIAKILEPEARTDVDSAPDELRTGKGFFLGSAPWSSPEQAMGEAIDHRSDLYSVGIILYELLTGSRPFSGPFGRLIFDHIHSAPPSFAKINPALTLPPALEEVVLRCLAKKPCDRPQTAQDLWADFHWAATDGKGSPSGSLAALRSPSGAVDSGRTDVDADFECVTPPTAGPLAQPYVGPTEPPDTVAATQRQTNPLTDLGNLRGELATEAYATTRQAGADTESGAPSGIKEPGVAGRRRGVWVLGFGLAAAAGLVLALLLPRRPAPPPECPPGYEVALPTADDPRPAALVRKADKTRFVLIRGGAFMMGNDRFDRTGQDTDEDRPAHRVTLTDFYLQETEVTNREMDAYFVERKMNWETRPPRFREGWDLIKKAGLDPAVFPAVGISHALAADYARSVGGKLPTEAQWEFAARSRGRPQRYVWDSDEKPSRRNANIASEGVVENLSTREVGSFPKDRTAEGVVDMTANVREWCRDYWARYTDSPVGLIDPQGPPGARTSGFDFVVRGSSFATPADLFRTTRPRRVTLDDHPTADMLTEDQAAYDIGFRVVIEWPRDR